MRSINEKSHVCGTVIHNTAMSGIMNNLAKHHGCDFFIVTSRTSVVFPTNIISDILMITCITDFDILLSIS